MFTGIIQETGKLMEIALAGSSARLTVHAPETIREAKTGDSICTNGVCLTATAFGGDTFIADVSNETLNRTTLVSLRPGTALNLEPALRPTDRLGGHIVSGHVDGVGNIDTIVEEGDFWRVSVRFPSELGRYIAEKGSLTVDGISLTVTDVVDNRAGFALVPHTVRNTNLYSKRTGDPVNIEVDVLARYLERLLTAGKDESRSELTADKLKRFGFI